MTRKVIIKNKFSSDFLQKADEKIFRDSINIIIINLTN
jgi:hypothetical protein